MFNSLNQPSNRSDQMSDSKFTDFNLAAPIQKSLVKIGYEKPTPIQEQTINYALAGHDVLGIAQTGTGKTAAFCLPLIDGINKKRLKKESRCPQALILTPTRELAIQIHQNLMSYGENLNQKYSVIFGGVSQNKQVRELKSGVDVLVATPGRLLDLIGQRHLNLKNVETFVLDEADRMLDMGFLKDIKKILPMLPKKRHNLFFSATMPNEIQKLASNILENPKTIEVTPPATTVKMISQSVMYVDKPNKIPLLIHLLESFKNHKTLVFVEMKHVANKVAKKLETAGISSSAIHGNKSQNARQKAIQDFANGDVDVLVATDIASRGIDIDGITHVINYELSNIAESYVHRIGRTARAGAKGSAISLVTDDEKSYLVNVERTTKQTIDVDEDHPFHSKKAQDAIVTKVGKAKKKIESQRKSEGRRPSGKKSSKKPGAKKFSGKKKPHSKSKDSSKKTETTSNKPKNFSKKKASGNKTEEKNKKTSKKRSFLGIKF